MKHPEKKSRGFLRGALILLGILLFLIFAGPILVSVKLNIGNLTGMLVALLLIFYGIFLEKIREWLRQGEKQKSRKIIWRGIQTLVVLVVLLAAVLTGCMMGAVKDKPVGKETLIVLGCRVNGEQPSLSLKERLDAAAEYLTAYPDTYCIVSGGKGGNGNITEAECMYRYLTEHGIQADRIFKEEKARTTRENIKYSMEIIREEKLPQEIAIATSEYHQFRAGMIAKKEGVENRAVSAKTTWWLLPTFYVRELYGILYQMIL